MWQWRTTNWRFQKWLNNTLGDNTIECKKLATIVSGRENVSRPFFRRKQLSASFLHSMVLLPKVLFNHLFSMFLIMQYTNNNHLIIFYNANYNFFVFYKGCYSAEKCLLPVTLCHLLYHLEVWKYSNMIFWILAIFSFTST